MSDELKNDLDVAASSDGLSLASGGGQSQQVVSAVEQAPPAPRRIVASQRAVRHRHVESGTPAPVEEEAGIPTTETELQSVEEAPVATTEDVPVAPRPTPVYSSIPGGSGQGRVGSRGGIGMGIEIMGVILRGGSAGEDHCEPPGRRGTRGPTIGINGRIPVIRGTFPARIASTGR